jgi:acetyl esterase/lipase
MPANVRPPFDPELEPALAQIGVQTPPTIRPSMIRALRAAPGAPTVDELIDGRPIAHREVRAPGYDGHELILSVFARTDHAGAGPGIYHTHGGGMIIGDRFSNVEVLLEWVDQFDAVCVSVEYRLAPEFRDPYPVQDCYAGLTWTADHAAELGIDPGRLIIAGASAGGGLAAGTALLARDRGGPALAGQVLIYPMLDDRNATVSSQQFVGIGVWDRESNETGWSAYLGERRGTDQVSIYAAPARAADLSGLPPAYIDVASAEVFRDEVVAYASQLWADGGVAELHVWPGGFHGCDVLVPHARLSQAMRQVRTEWVGRLLAE